MTQEKGPIRKTVARVLAGVSLLTPMAGSGEEKPEVTPTVDTSVAEKLEGAIPSQAVLDEMYGINEITEKEDFLNQQFSDFINNEGDFTKEKKSQMAIESETTEKLGKTELGVADRQPKLEGYLFDYVEKDGSLLLIMGFDDKDGNGFITPIQIPLYFLKGLLQEDKRP